MGYLDTERHTLKLAYSVPEACDALSISRTVLYRLIAAGELETVKIGARTVVRATELERFLSSRVSS